MPPPRINSARLDALIQQAVEPLLLLGHDRRIVLVNRAWEDLTGHTFEQVAGLECNPHGPTRSGDLVGLGGSFCPPPEAMAGQPSGSNTLILHASGERRWRRLEYWPFHDDKGALSWLLGLVRPPESTTHAPGSDAQRLRVELLELRQRLHDRHGFDTLIGQGPEHRRLVDQIFAATTTTVPALIVGEPGAGKRMVARLIHQQGSRRQAPLLSYQCKALTPEILERELFGLVGRNPERSLVAPDGSTLLIGDILDLPRDLQEKLATGLDRRVRLIATTSGDPEVALKSEQLRPDLYYALTTLVLRLRPLRERLNELPALAQHFLERANLRGDRQRDGFSAEALDILAGYDWPGNLRELSRVIDDAHAKGDHTLIQADDITPAICGQRGGAYTPPSLPVEPTSLKEMLTRVERRLIEQALEKARQNKSRAAKLLGINRPLLYRRIKELEIPDEAEPLEESGGEG